MFQPDKLAPLIEAKPDAVAAPFTLESLIAWLRTKDGDETYCFVSTGDCLIAKYMKAHNVQFDAVGGDYFVPKWGKPDVRLPASYVETAVGHPRTFGAALARAEKLLASGRTPLPSNEAKRSGSL